ncbi:MAG: hypothetical protein J6Z49_10705 [Kiritimatiellae bacterium]|nr:hypothetical protein [Kiritimatiellia bacterium]
MNIPLTKAPEPRPNATANQKVTANQKTLLYTAGPLLAAAAIYFLLFQPAQERGEVLKREITGLEEQTASMHADVKGMLPLRDEVKALSKARDEFLNGAELLPLFSSYGRRAGQRVKTHAVHAGFDLVDNTDLPAIPLRPPEGVNFPDGYQFFSRQPVEFKGTASFFQLADFIARVEKAFPSVALYSLSIRPHPTTPKQHKVTVAFEWPVKGERLSLAPKGGNK